MTMRDLLDGEKDSYFLLVSATISVLLVYLTSHKAKVKSSHNPKNLPLPPGPKGWPLIGILFDMPSYKPWVRYNEWAKIYGDMFYFEAMGQKFLILNSLKRANDLFDKRSSNYSDRLQMPMMTDLMHWNDYLVMMPYGSLWRRHRRSFNEYFHRNTVHRYLPIQARETRAFLHRLLVSPDNLFHHVRQAFSATIMSVLYGIEVKDSDDPYISRAEIALNGFSAAAVPGSYLVDFFPFLKYVPSWLPGANFKRQAQMWREVNEDVGEIPFKRVEDEMKAGIAPPSVAVNLIDRLPPKSNSLREEERVIAKNVAAAAYFAGADTTVSSVQTFFLAMALHPEIQKKAHDELDRVIGPNRLPDFSDRKDLPYINALVKETMRWNVVLPLAVPHTSSNDDEYDGYFIPKGTIILGNSWSILHDPDVFKNPSEYIPERFLKNGQLDPDVSDPDTAAFGYGRRLCPGRHMSDKSLFSIVSSVLAVYNITPPLDELGKPIKLKPEFTSGTLTYPVAFKCTIKPRSPTAAKLIRDHVELADQ